MLTARFDDRINSPQAAGIFARIHLPCDRRVSLRIKQSKVHRLSRSLRRALSVSSCRVDGNC